MLKTKYNLLYPLNRTKHPGFQRWIHFIPTLFPSVCICLALSDTHDTQSFYVYPQSRNIIAVTLFVKVTIALYTTHWSFRTLRRSSQGLSHQLLQLHHCRAVSSNWPPSNCQLVFIKWFQTIIITLFCVFLSCGKSSTASQGTTERRRPRRFCATSSRPWRTDSFWRVNGKSVDGLPTLSSSPARLGGLFAVGGSDRCCGPVLFRVLFIFFFKDEHATYSAAACALTLTRARCKIYASVQEGWHPPRVWPLIELEPRDKNERAGRH